MPEKFTLPTGDEFQLDPQVLFEGDRPASDDEFEYSGFIIIRLVDELKEELHGDNLVEMAREYGLDGLVSIFDEFGFEEVLRLVRSLEPATIFALEEEAARTDLPPLHSLASYWRLDVRDREEQVYDLIEQLNELAEVDLAYQELAASDPLVHAIDLYAGDQGYLDPAPVGIDARWAWTQLGSNSVALVDLEQGWFLDHEDLVHKSPSSTYGDNRDGVGTYKGDHGAAALGIVIAEDKTEGTVGIAPTVASARVVSHYHGDTDTAGHVADAIGAVLAMKVAGDLQDGDVLLLEVERSSRPTEIDDADFDAIRLAVTGRIVVVEAAGNNYGNLDEYKKWEKENGVFTPKKILHRDLANPDFQDSGAIMVGSAESAEPHNRKDTSNYGSRLDCYAWGENVVTCGYGDLDNGGGDDNRAYTDTFNGTSAAAAIIAGAAILLQSFHEATKGSRLSPSEMQTLLASTGTPQGPGRPGHIGLMPDLRAIIESL